MKIGLYKDFGAPKLKLGSTAQKIRSEMRHRLMCCGNQSDDLSITTVLVPLS